MMNLPVLKSALRPITRVLVGVIAIPIFRFIMRRVFRLQDLDDELEKDLEQWFRGALLLLAASANMEHLLFGWMTKLDWMDRADWLTMGLRLMLAIGVIEAMPDQELFAVIHPGPPKVKPGKSFLKEFWRMKWLFLKGFVCQHLNRSSPVLAMMAAIVGAQILTVSEVEQAKLDKLTYVQWGYVQQITPMVPAQQALAMSMSHENDRDFRLNLSEVIQIDSQFRRSRERWIVGWCCYLLAITQYLIIGLVTSRDRAMDVLSEFDRAVAVRRKQLMEEFEIPEDVAANQAAAASQKATDTTGPNQPTISVKSGTHPPASDSQLPEPTQPESTQPPGPTQPPHND